MQRSDKESRTIAEKGIPLTEVDWDTQALGPRVDQDTQSDLGHRLKMSPRLGRAILSYAPIHPRCPNPPL